MKKSMFLTENELFLQQKRISISQPFFYIAKENINLESCFFF